MIKRALGHALNNKSNYINFKGITRLERWERAANYGLHPPQEVKDIVEQHLGDSQYTEWLDNICIHI